MEYVGLACFWVFFFTLHSVLALLPVKNRFFSMGISPMKYRLAYNIIALVTLIPIVVYSAAINSGYVILPTNLTKYTGLLLAGWGVIIVRAAFKSYDTKAFLGLHNLEKENEFTNWGLLKYVRHPMYSGSILGIIGYFFYTPKLSTLISAGMIIIYFVVGIYIEEKKLIAQFGKTYLDYKKITPMLIPRFKRK